jgi:hypothetical protein
MHSIYTVFTLLHPFPTYSLLPLIPTPQSLFCPPVFCFCSKKRHFCLFKIAIHGVSSWHFNVYMYYNLNWFSSLQFFSFLPCPLMVISTGLKILCSFLYKKFINLIHLLNFLLLPFLSYMWSTLSMPYFHNITCIRSVFHIWQKVCELWLSEPV